MPSWFGENGLNLGNRGQSKLEQKDAGGEVYIC